MFIMHFLISAKIWSRLKMKTQDKTFFRYLPVSGTDRDWGCFLTGGGYTSIPANTAYPPKGHPTAYDFTWDKGRVLQEYQILYITHGAGVFESTPTGRLKIKAGDAMLLFPGIWHRYTPLKKTGWDEHWLALHGDFMDRLVEKGFLTPQHPILSIGFDETLLACFFDVFNDLRNEPIGFQQEVASLAILILSKALANVKASGGGGSRIEGLVRQAKCIMAERLDETLDMKKMARDLHLSYVYFRHIFKYYTGIAPHHYHLQLRINRAREMLKGTQLSVKDVAATLGFENQNYFSRLFKKKVGLSPEQWRNM